MKRLYIITVLVALLSVSCNDWLDVRPDTEQKDKDLFTTYKGFQDALTGCYMSLASQDVYGERLTMSNIESLANLWYQFRNSTRYEDNDLMNHDYTGDYSKRRRCRWNPAQWAPRCPEQPVPGSPPP